MRPEQNRRLFVESLAEATTGRTIQLDANARKHARVLRLRDGVSVELFDGKGRLVYGVLAGKGVEVRKFNFAAEPKPRLGLIQALPKGAKSDEIVRMSTELGAAEIVFTHAERTGAASAAEKKYQRWVRIAREAARQSERLYVPAIRLTPELSEALRDIPSDAGRFYAWARSEDSSPVVESAEERWVAIGPEGGFSDSERGTFEAAGFRPISLGRHILRVDTAACAALALLAAP